MKMNDNGYVTIHKRYLKTYLAVKEKVLMIHIDSRCVSIDNSEKIKEDGLVYRNSENTIFYALNIGNTSTGLKGKIIPSFMQKMLSQVAVYVIVIFGRIMKKRLMLILLLV